ncbi:MAG: ParB/RepB/Spo0J family partition protein [Planctomycetota bacterium]|nr:ParB/RepB/Spo0J family partition protein [Planctomycetota bacterium]
MTKDRRLGRGLAALLGTQVEDGAAPNQQPLGSAAEMTSGIAMPSPEPMPSRDNAAIRNEAIRSLAKDAHARVTPNRSGISPITIPMAPVESSNSATHTTLEIETSLIDANPFQPRRQFNPSELESLAESLKEHKQLQPILVRRVGQRYQLISGERRLRATVLAGLPTIRAEVRQADDRLVAELAIIENLQRKDLNAIEKALSFKRYITEHKCTQDELAQRLKIDRSTIANMMRLLELPDAITDAVQRDEVSAGHAKALLSLGSIKEQVSFLKKIREEGWSVRETEARVAEAIAAAADSDDGVLGVIPRRKASKSDQLASLENDIKMFLGTRVDISQTSRGRGRITIHFTSIEEFDRLKQVLSNEPKRKAA